MFGPHSHSGGAIPPAPFFRWKPEARRGEKSDQASRYLYYSGLLIANGRNTLTLA